MIAWILYRTFVFYFIYILYSLNRHEHAYKYIYIFIRCMQAIILGNNRCLLLWVFFSLSSYFSNTLLPRLFNTFIIPPFFYSLVLFFYINQIVIVERSTIYRLFTIQLTLLYPSVCIYFFVISFQSFLIHICICTLLM